MADFQKMRDYVEDLLRYGEVVVDYADINDFFNFCYSHNLPFDPDDLRRDSGTNLIYLA